MQICISIYYDCSVCLFFLYKCDLNLWTYIFCLLLPFLKWCDGHDGNGAGVFVWFIASQKFLNFCLCLRVMDQYSTSKHIYANVSAEGDGDYEEDEDLTAEILAQSGYGKVVSRNDSSVGDQECMFEDEKEANSELGCAQTSSHSHKSWPSDKKLVSAFKGSREKEGVHVTWAPDVYDPPVTSDDHFVQDKSEKHKGENRKQKGKQKREGKSAREEKGKGKRKDKQTRKHGGSSNK
ncbi:hypothetical protein DCAR_0208340 [Daucus carota subsp. sativus]|uniref:Uncharacterized protein n=1 Tax=Daucus carota subsp. sativus TaxID=79200 RepID=A0AAF0WG83_DAUCS|nr:hypothetical protein DCAR_0208340 [Daucus carota subsp. sativus]